MLFMLFMLFGQNRLAIVNSTLDSLTHLIYLNFLYIRVLRENFEGATEIEDQMSPGQYFILLWTLFS